MQAALLELPIDLSREARALEGLKIALEAGCGLDLDPDFLHDLAEGQTNLFEAIDALLHDDLQDRMLLEGVKFVLKDLQARQDRIETRSETRRALFEQALSILERKSLERPTATITLASRPPILSVTDESQIPSHFFKAKPVLDRKALKDALERGETAPGAHLTNGSMSLSIRRR